MQITSLNSSFCIYTLYIYKFSFFMFFLSFPLKTIVCVSEWSWFAWRLCVLVCLQGPRGLLGPKGPPGIPGPPVSRSDFTPSLLLLFWLHCFTPLWPLSTHSTTWTNSQSPGFIPNLKMNMWCSHSLLKTYQHVKKWMHDIFKLSACSAKVKF